MPATGLPTSLSATHTLHERDPVRVLVRNDWADALPVEALLDGAELADWGRPVRHELRGRSEVHLLGTDAGSMVAKQLSRGGVVGGLLRHWFADADRPFREADVAERLAAAGCATPPVVVARSTRGPMGLYRLELGTVFRAEARDLLAVLRASEPGSPALADLAARGGACIRRLHDVGLRHRDLQVKNLLVPDEGGALVVIDLDRCTLDGSRPLDREERLAALTRFARSLVKRGVLAAPGGGPERGDGSEPVLGTPEVAAFLEAHGTLEELDLDALREALCERLARQVARHRLAWRGASG